MSPQVFHTGDAMGLARLIASRRFIIQLSVICALVLAGILVLASKLDRIADRVEALEKAEALRDTAAALRDTKNGEAAALRHGQVIGDVHATKVAVDTLAAWYQNDYREKAGAQPQNGGK